MDYFARIGEQRANKLSKEYSNNYATYNCISSVIDSIESQRGGLYPVEVWYEVLRLEGELKRSNGMLNNEKFIRKAPAEKVAAEKEKLAKYQTMMAKVEEELKALQ